MRLFTAIRLPDEVRQHLERIQKIFRERLRRERASWVAPNNFHITLKFLGEVESQRADLLRAHLRNVEVAPMLLIPDRIERFPRRGPVRVVAVGFGGDVGKSQQLFDAIETALKLVEISRERRRFTAHATLARYRDGARYLGDAEPLAEELLPGPAFQVASFELIQSKLGPNGSTYETAEKFLSL